MRMLATALVFALAACSPPSGSAPSTTTTEPTATAAFGVTAAQLGGQWSFGRDCGLSDLVFTDSDVSYYDYADPSNVISYVGAYAITGDHVAMTLHRLDAQGAPTGNALSYTLDIAAPVTTNLAGHFGPARGAMHDINAKQCAYEDRE